MITNNINLIAALLCTLLPYASYASLTSRVKAGGKSVRPAITKTSPQRPSQTTTASPKAPTKTTEKTSISGNKETLRRTQTERGKEREEEIVSPEQEAQKLKTRESVAEAIDEIIAAKNMNIGTVVIQRDATDLINYIQKLAANNGIEIIPDTWLSITQFGKEILKFKQFSDGTIEYLKSPGQDSSTTIVADNYWPNSNSFGGLLALDSSIAPQIHHSLVKKQVIKSAEAKQALIDRIENAEIEALEQDIQRMEQEQELEEATIKKEQNTRDLAQKLHAEEEAAKQKAAAELARIKEEQLKKEVDAEYELYEKEATEIERIEQEVTEREEDLRQFRLKQEQIVASKTDQERLLKQIAEDEAGMEQLENKLASEKLKWEQTRKSIEEYHAAQELELQEEADAHAMQEKNQKIEHQKALEISKAETSQAQKEYMEAEQKAQETENRLDASLKKLQQAENNLQAKKDNITADTQEIEKLEAELAKIKNKSAEIQQREEEAKANFAQQKTDIEAKAQAELKQIEQETTEKLQQIRTSLEKSQDFINKTAQEKLQELEKLEATSKNELIEKQQLIEKAKNETKQHITANYKRNLELFYAELETFQKQQLQSQELGSAQLKPQTEQLQPQELGQAKLEQQKQQLQSQELGKAKLEQETIKTIEEKAEQKTTPEKKEPEVKKNEQGEGGTPDTKDIQEYKEEIRQEQKEEKAEHIEATKKPSTFVPLSPSKTSEPTYEALPEVIIEKVAPSKETPIAETHEPYFVPLSHTASENKLENKLTSPTPPYSTPRRPTGRRRRPFYAQSGVYPEPAKGTGTSIAPSTPSSPTSVENFPSNSTSAYTTRTGDKIISKPITKEPASETERIKKIQPQSQTWWEKMLANWKELLPDWIKGQLQQKIQLQDKINQKTPEIAEISAPEETIAQEAPQKESTGAVKTIIEAIKQPISNVIDYIRQWWKSS